LSRSAGAAAEAQAAAFLEKKGYRVVARNVSARGGELDIVAVDRGVVCFVEVRARASDGWGAAEETVGPTKQARLARVAERFLGTWPDRDAACRFDVVAVAPGPRFTLIRDAFRP
jgi:putative endonuclease